MCDIVDMMICHWRSVMLCYHGHTVYIRYMPQYIEHQVYNNIYRLLNEYNVLGPNSLVGI